MTIPSLHETLPDETLVIRVCAGQVGLFELLVRRHNQRLFRVARSIMHNNQEAEDVVQEAYVCAYTKLHTFEGRSKFSTWLTRITVRQALSRKRRRREALADQHMEESMADPSRSPECVVADAQLGRLIETAIDRLPEHYRLVFMLRAVQELSIAETAACLEIEEPTVKTRLHRAKKLLRELLDDPILQATPSVHAFDGSRCDRLTKAVMARISEPADPAPVGGRSPLR